MTKIKFCKVQTADEMRIAQDLGIDFVGLHQLYPEKCSDDVLRFFARMNTYGTDVVVVTKNCEISWIYHITKTHRYRYIQLHIHLTRVNFRVLRNFSQRFGTRFILTVDPHLNYRREHIWQAAETAWAVLFDNQAGGLGSRIDLSRVPNMLGSDPPNFLVAGGLTPENVSSVIASTRPWGIDVQSAIRREGRWDQRLAHAFVDAVRSGAVSREEGERR